MKAIIVKDFSMLRREGKEVEIIVVIPPNSTIGIKTLSGPKLSRSPNYPVYLCNAVDGSDIGSFKDKKSLSAKTIKLGVNSISYIDSNKKMFLGTDVFCDAELDIQATSLQM